MVSYSSWCSSKPTHGVTQKNYDSRIPSSTPYCILNSCYELGLNFWNELGFTHVTDPVWRFNGPPHGTNRKQYSFKNFRFSLSLTRPCFNKLSLRVTECLYYNYLLTDKSKFYIPYSMLQIIYHKIPMYHSQVSVVSFTELLH